MIKGKKALITLQELEDKYSKLETFDLLEIVANKPGYTELAIFAASEELKRRRVPREEIKNYRSVFSLQKDKVLQKANYLVDLALWQKLLFYIWWVPKFRHELTRNFSPNGYVLKSQQASYYSITGFCIFMCSAAYYHKFSGIIILSFWIGGFIPVYLFDVYYNKKRQIRIFEKTISEGKIPTDAIA